jgi:hypothetical protein
MPPMHPPISSILQHTQVEKTIKALKLEDLKAPAPAHSVLHVQLAEDIVAQEAPASSRPPNSSRTPRGAAG